MRHVTPPTKFGQSCAQEPHNAGIVRRASRDPSTPLQFSDISLQTALVRLPTQTTHIARHAAKTHAPPSPGGPAHQEPEAHRQEPLHDAHVQRPRYGSPSCLFFFFVSVPVFFCLSQLGRREEVEMGKLTDRIKQNSLLGFCRIQRRWMRRRRGAAPSVHGRPQAAARDHQQRQLAHGPPGQVHHPGRQGHVNEAAQLARRTNEIERAADERRRESDRSDTADSK